MKGTGADLLVAYLEAEGVRYVFGVPGGHLLPFYDALLGSTIEPILTKHEGGAGYMAAGHALAGGGLGVCVGTVGPGATNLVSGIAAAHMASLPVLAITAQVGTPTIGKGGLQEAAGENSTFSHCGIFSPITKHSTMVGRSDKLGEAFRRAVRAAYSGRPGPVHLDLPADVQRGGVDESVQDPERYRPRLRTRPPDEAIRRAAELLLSARRPGILAGAGVRQGEAPRHLRRLAETAGIPVGTTLPGKGALPEDHPLALGVIGLYGSRAANAYLRSGLDVLLVAGSSLHEFTTHVWDPALQPAKAFVQIDVDPREIGKNYPVDVGLLGDSEPTLAALADEVASRRPDPALEEGDLRAFKEEHEYFSEPAMASHAVPIKPQRAVAEVRRALAEDAMVFTDIGNNLAWVERNFMAMRPDSTMSLCGLAAMGSGVAGVIGGKLARPERQAVCVCGDGDFQMHGMEVMTAVNYDVPVVWVILQNDQLAMVKDVQIMAYKGRTTASSFDSPDFVRLAEAFGAGGYRPERPGDVAEAVREALASDRPAVVAVPIDADEMPPAKARMMAMERSLGNPPVHKTLSFSLDSLRTLRSMFRER